MSETKLPKVGACYAIPRSTVWVQGKPDERCPFCKRKWRDHGTIEEEAALLKEQR